MTKIRVMPILLLSNGDLVKTKNFKNPVYLGDPLNAIRIFNQKCVDELVLLDIDASKFNTPPDFELIDRLTKECFMPVSYGGGITCLSDASKLLRLSVEKIIINSSSFAQPDLIPELVLNFGSQAIVASVDVKKPLFGDYNVVSQSASRKHAISLYRHIDQLICQGIGEIILTNVSREGLMNGYDIDLIKSVTERVNVPVIASGGAGKIADLFNALHLGGADAAAAGSMFVFHGKYRGILISYPDEFDLTESG